MRAFSPRLPLLVHVAGAALPALGLVALGDEHWMPAAALHFWLVGGAAAVAALASASLTAAGAARGDGRAVLLGTCLLYTSPSPRDRS